MSHNSVATLAGSVLALMLGGAFVALIAGLWPLVAAFGIWALVAFAAAMVNESDWAYYRRFPEARKEGK